MTKNSDVLEILSNRDIYPYDNYAERAAYIRSATGPVGTEEDECAKALITLIIGGANTGKSCLFNRLIGEDFSPVMEISGYTGDFFIAHAPDSDLSALEEISPDQDKIYKSPHKWMAGKILVDTPDFDSINDYNRKRLEQIIPSAHVVVVLVTAAKREIAPLAEILLRYVGRKTFIFVMNKQDREDDYSREFSNFLENCGFPDPQVIRASSVSENGPGVANIESAISQVDQKRAKIYKHRGDIRDSVELLYNPGQVRNTINLLREKSGEFQSQAKKILQSEITSIIDSLALHPKIIRDVVLVEVAGKRWLILSLLLRVWARHRYLLALSGAGTVISRVSGSAIPFLSGVASGFLAQAGEVSSLKSLRDAVARGLKKSTLSDFCRSKYQEIKDILKRHMIRKDLYPDLSTIEAEYGFYLEQAVQGYLGGLIKKSYLVTLYMGEMLVWAGTGGYLYFRAKSLYEHNQITIEAIVLAGLVCFTILAGLLLCGFVFYVGASTGKMLKKMDAADINMELSQPLQPAIDALEYFGESAEKALNSIGKN